MNRFTLTTGFVSILTLLFLFTPSEVFAGKVLQVKGKRAIISLDGELATRGDVYFATYKGKKRAIMQVIKATKSKAIVLVRKGRAIKGMNSEPRKAPSAQGRSGKSKMDKIGSQIRSGLSLGVIAGLGVDSQDVVLTPENGDGETVSMTGTGINVKIAGDYDFADSLGVRAGVGIEQFNVYGEAGSNLCDDESTTECATELSFITLDGLFRWKYLTGDFAGWVGAGAGILIPSASDSNALNSESIGTTSIISFGTGLDISLGKSIYIPIQIDYGIIPPSSDVSTSILGIKGGLMFKF